VLAGAAVPVAVLANALRVAGIATAAHLYGAEAVHGAPHLVIGKVVWIVTIAGLMGLGLLLRRLGRRMPPPVTAEA
jgi:exosortase/archaeosortase family protein